MNYKPAARDMEPDPHTTTPHVTSTGDLQKVL
jgi:hypothetical protein